MIPGKYTSLEAIPEPMREHYKQVGTVWLLVTDAAPEGYIERSKFEAKDTEAKDLKGKLTAFGDLNADQVRADLAELGSFRQSFGGNSSADAKTAIETQAKAMAASQIQAKENERAAMQTRAENAERHASSLVIDNDLQSKLAAAGVLPEALSDAVRIGRDVFRYKDGKAVGYDGENPKLNGKGEPFTIDDFVSDVKATRKYFFAPSQGGGSTQTGNRGSGNGDSDYRNADGTVNDSKLYALKGSNPARYQQIVDSGEHLKDAPKAA